MNSLFSNLTIWYFIINKLLFKAIFKNTLALIYIFKLLAKYGLDCKKIKVFKVSNALAVNYVEDNALLYNIKSLSHIF